MNTESGAPGAGFIADTLRHLCDTWQIELPDVQYSEQETYEMEIYQAYAHAAMIIKHSNLSDRVKGKICELKWSVDVLNAVGIGSVKCYDDYISRMTRHYGHEMSFLQQVDLDRKGIFNENNLIYTIKDEHGSPVAFAARDLLYEEKAAKYKKECSAIEAQFPGDKIKIDEEKAKLFKPAKYNNSKETGYVDKETQVKNRIFKKGEILFNFDLARKAVPPLWIVEGQADCVTLYANGLKNVVALGSSSLTTDHIEVLLRHDPPIKHVIFCLDPDKAGKDGIKRAIRNLEEVFSGNVGMQVDIIQMPEGGGDPDRFVRTFGINSFRAIERLDLFSWRMKEAVENGEDPTEVADHAVGLILNQPNILRRRQMAKRLASVCCQPEDVIWAEVERRVNADKAAIEEQKSAVASKMVREIQKNPGRAAWLISEAQAQIELVDKTKHGYDLKAAVDALDVAYELADKNNSEVGIYTGWEYFDKVMYGLPKFGKFISMPGKPNAGKSTFMDNLAWHVAEHPANKDVIVLFHTADDSLYERHSRILGSRFNVPSKMFESPGAFLGNAEACKKNGVENFEELLSKGRQWLRRLFEEERLIVADITGIAPTFPALGRYVADMRKRFPEKNILVLEDNFHLLEMPGFDAGEAKIAASSHFMKALCTSQQVTILATMELTKADLATGKRPYFSNLKGSSAIPYDINANLSIYNDMSDLLDEAEVYWEDIHNQKTTELEGITYNESARMPALEAICDKNKISGWKGTLFYRLWPMSGHLEECPEDEAATFQVLTTRSAKEQSTNPVALQAQ